MRRHAVRNSSAVLLEHGDALLVESPVGERFPVDMGVLSLTSRCDLDCVMCLEPPRGTAAVDLPYSAAMTFVERFAGRVPTIWTCAGEALLFPRFFDVARAIACRGTRLGVGTNGLPLSSADVVARCAGAGVRCLHISCHTVRPARYATLTGATDPRRFDQFVRGLRNVDDWNRDHDPARRLEVLLQLVLMRPFDEELEEYLGFLAETLPHSAPVLRVEPMQMMNRGARHPELQYAVDELAGLVRALTHRRAPPCTFEFKSMPLCILDGVEHLSEDLRTRAAGTVVVGNLGSDSAELQLQCPIGDPMQSAQAACCAGCTLVNLCPGVMDAPVPPGCPWPRARTEPAEELLARLGLRTDFARRRFAMVYPLHATTPDPDLHDNAPVASEPTPPQHDTVPAELAAEHLALESSDSFSPAQLGLLQQVGMALRREGAVSEMLVTERFAALRLRTEAPNVVVFEPGAVTRQVFAAGGIAVRYCGELTPGLRGYLERFRRFLQRHG